MTNEISMGDLMNAIESIDEKITQRVEARLNITTDRLMIAIESLDNKLTQKLETRLNATTSELMNAINTLDSKLNQHDTEFTDLHEAIQLLAATNDEQLMILKSQMVTKDYLDEKMGDLRGDLVQLTHMENEKVDAFIKINQAKKFLTAAEAKRLITMGPFPKLAL